MQDIKEEIRVQATTKVDTLEVKANAVQALDPKSEEFLEVVEPDQGHEPGL